MAHFIQLRREEPIKELALTFVKKSGACMGSLNQLSLTEIPHSRPSFEQA